MHRMSREKNLILNGRRMNWNIELIYFSVGFHNLMALSALQEASEELAFE